MKPTIFLISTGRTGTKFFSIFFKTIYPSSIVFHTSKYTRFINIVGNMYQMGLLREKTIQLIWATLKYRDINCWQHLYIESNPYYYSFINTIDQYYPNVKFVVIVRHPKSFITSHINWERHRFQNRIANGLVPFWQPISYFEQLKGFRNDIIKRIEFYSKVWQKKNESILHQILNKKNVTIVKFEDVFDPNTGINIIQELVSWLEIPSSTTINRELIRNKINVSRKSPSFWNGQCECIMRRYCESLMARFGYD